VAVLSAWNQGRDPVQGNRPVTVTDAAELWTAAEPGRPGDFGRPWPLSSATAQKGMTLPVWEPRRVVADDHGKETIAL
jgi:hypothetical protein